MGNADPGSAPRVVLLAQEGESSNIIFHYLAAHLHVEKVLFERPIERLAYLQRRLGRLGAATVAGQVAFRLGVVPLLAAGSRRRRREILDGSALRDDPPDERLVARVPSVNSDETIDWLRVLRPDVVVLSGTRIVAAQVLDSVAIPFVNLHAGITPLYRGVHGGYWALVERRADACGVTAHLVDAGLDTGAILGQALIEPTENDNFTTYPVLQLAAGVPLLERAVRAAANGEPRRLPAPPGESRLRTHPTLQQYVRFRMNLGVK